MPQGNVQTVWGAYFQKGIWKYIRNQFGGVGQDSFTRPPTQNEDMFQALLNVLPPLRGTFDLRWGYNAFNLTGGIGQTINAVVPVAAYQNDLQNYRLLIFPFQDAVLITDEEGVTQIPSLFDPVGFPLRSINSRSYQYFASGSLADLLKWDGGVPGVLSLWGIQAPAGLVTAPPSAAVGNDATTPGHGPLVWANPTNVFLLDGAFATVTSDGVAASSAGLKVTGFGFAIPTGAVVQGVQVNVTGNWNWSNPAAPTPTSRNATLSGFLVKNGNVLNTAGGPGTDKTALLNTVLNETVTLGGPTSQWGTSLSGADVNNGGFGVSLVAHGPGPVRPHFVVPGPYSPAPAGSTVNIDLITITVFFGTKLVATPGGPGAITLVSGRTYFQVWRNSITGHISDLGSPSNNTGPITNSFVDVTNLLTSPDPQVDTTILLATSDGGNQELLYFVAEMPNGTAAYHDNTPDTQLVLQNVYLEADDAGNEIGVSFNDRPPADLQFPLKHRGRVYGVSQAKNLFFSKAESELITQTGLLVGKYEESWPPTNYFDITSGAELILGLLSDGQVLYIGTERRILRLFGDGPTTYLFPETLFDNTGIMNQDVWRVVFLEGNPVGGMWLTHDLRVLGSDFNTYQDVGLPVQDVLNSINQTTVQQNAWAMYAAIGQYNFYMLAIPTGNNTNPDTLLIFDLKLRQWVVWQLADDTAGGYWDLAVLDNESQPIFVAASGKIYTFDANSLQDRIGDTPLNIPYLIQTSWLALGDPTARKYLNEVEITTDDPGLLLTCEGASTTAEMSAALPNVVVADDPLVIKPLGEYAAFLAPFSTRDRYYRLTFHNPIGTPTITQLLQGFSVEGNIIHRL
jgi:hypothetical protein